MDPLFINKVKIKQDNHGWYIAKDLCKQLFPTDKAMQKKALLCSYADSIDNLSDFIVRVANRCNVPRKDLFSKLCFTRPVSPQKMSIQKGAKKRLTWKRVMEKNSTPPKEWDSFLEGEDEVVLPTDKPLNLYDDDAYMDFDDEMDSLWSNDDDDEQEKPTRPKKVVSTGLDLSDLPSESESSSSSSPVVIAPKGLKKTWDFNHRPVAGKRVASPKKYARVVNNTLITFEDRVNMLNANARALRAVSQLYASCKNGDKNNDNVALHDELESLALTYVDSIKRLGPIEDGHTKFLPGPRPEKSGEPLFGASERARALGMDPDKINTAQVGKEALKLYKEKYFPHVPLRRKCRDSRGFSYFMNVYSEESARDTLDVALRK